MNALRYELKVAGRGLLAQPMFSALVVGVLGAGMACVIYMLIAIGSMVLRPLPFPEPQRLHYVGAEDGGGGRLAPLRADDLLGLRRQLDGRAEVAARGEALRCDVEDPLRRGSGDRRPGGARQRENGDGDRRDAARFQLSGT